MKTEEITIGTKLKLNVEGKVREYKITVIDNGMFKIFNKFVISRFVTLDYINANLAE